MYIEPNSNIVLLKGIRLDNSYDHTIYFVNKQAQYNYFYSKKKVEFTQNYYQRVERGYFKADINAEQLYDVSYMMFRNTAFGDRWFYAFVTSAEYVNNRVTRIGFELDVMQTWMFDYTLLESWVEREHIAHDTIGNNIVPENLNVGDYMIEERTIGIKTDTDLPLTLTPCIVVATTEDWVRQDSQQEHGTHFTYKESVTGGMYGRVFTGVKYKVFHKVQGQIKFVNSDTVANVTPTEPIDIVDWLKFMVDDNKKDAIVSIFMYYEELVPTIGTYNIVPIKLYVNNNYGDAFGSYIPRNKKLYTFPFNVLSVTDNRSGMTTYKMEYWRGENPQFALYGGLSCDPSMMIVPINYNYKDTAGSDEYNYDEKMVAKGFPPCSFDIDAFKAYIAQNGGVLGMGASIGLTMAESVCQFGQIAQSQMGEIINGLNNGHQPRRGISAEQGAGILKGIAPVVESARELYIASTKPNQLGGNANGDVIFSSDLQQFSFEIKHIRPEYARIIDSYFDMYGYATKELKIPNTHSRAHWNYVKTANCAIETDINIDDSRRITDIYDKGITFWKNGDEIGDYSLDNRAW